MSSYDEHLISMAGGDGDEGFHDCANCDVKIWHERALCTLCSMRADRVIYQSSGDDAEADRETENLATIVRLNADNEALRATIDRALNLANTRGRCGWSISSDELRKVLGAS